MPSVADLGWWGGHPPSPLAFLDQQWAYVGPENKMLFFMLIQRAAGVIILGCKLSRNTRLLLRNLCYHHTYKFRRPHLILHRAVRPIYVFAGVTIVRSYKSYISTCKCKLQFGTMSFGKLIRLGFVWQMFCRCFPTRHKYNVSAAPLFCNSKDFHLHGNVTNGMCRLSLVLTNPPHHVC